MNDLEKENEIFREKSNNMNNNDENNVIKENREIDEKNKLKEYYENVIDLNNKRIELMKCRLNIISENNFKKSIIPTFKSKNPISNLDIDIKLFDPGKEENNIENEEEGQELAPPEDDNWLDPENEGNISDIEKEKE